MLKRVSIQNFKSLKNVTLDLQKVNLLIGPNNSGKTNFLKALEYMAKENVNLPEINYNRLVFQPFLGKPIQIELYYEQVTEYEESLIFGCHIPANEDIEKTESILQDGNKSLRVSSRFPGYKYDNLKNRLGPATIYKPDPNKLTQPAPVGEGAETVDADASNLVAFLDNALGEYRVDVFDRITSDLTTCVSEFTEVNLQNVKPTEELIKLHDGKKTFKRLGLTHGRQKVKYWADELSEGTLYFLALLCIINQPNPPKLLLLEEPEKGIHPRRIEEVVNFILGLADEKDIQVIMTTHSPIIVDMFKDMPESVFIFDKDDEGATGIKNLQKHIIEPENQESERLGIDPPQYLNGLGQAWKVGFIGGVPK